MPSCSEPVTAITISITGSSLLVGTEGGLVHSYDIVSHQLLRTISSHKGGTITFLRSILKPVDLVGHVSLNLHVSGVTDAKDVIPVRPVLPFQRIKDVKLRDTHEVTIMLAAVRNVSEARSSVSRSHRILYVAARPRILGAGTSRRLCVLRPRPERGIRRSYAFNRCQGGRVRSRSSQAQRATGES